MIHNMRDFIKAVYNKPEDTRSATVKFHQKLNICLKEYDNDKQHEASQFMRDTLEKLLEAMPEKKREDKPKDITLLADLFDGIKHEVPACSSCYS